MLNKKEIAKFIKESVEWLIKERQGCCTYELDDHLAICVGWSSGYGDKKRSDVIQDADDLDWGIDVGLKVWTSDYCRTDYDLLNFPYEEDGEVWDMGFGVPPNANYNSLAKDLLDWYGKAKDLNLTDGGLIIKDESEGE